MAEPISMVSFLSGLFTSAPLFLFLNIVICTILFTSRFSSKKREEHHETRQLARPPSLVERVKSINFSFYHYSSPFPETHTQTEPVTEFVENREPTGRVDPSVRMERASSLLERVKSINFSSFYRSEQAGAPDLDPHESSGYEEEEHHVRRSKSESESRVTSQNQAPEKMKKSASERVITAEEERETVEKRRPATTKMEKMVSFGDEAVDAKADDFINRFKQQLKLQRLDSLLRYKEMLRGH